MDPKLFQQLRDIENKSEDEFAELLSTGPEFYETSDLLILFGKWQERFLIFRSLYQWMFKLVTFSVISLVLGVAFGFLQWRFPALFCLAFFPLSFALILIIAVWLKVRFNSQGHLEFIGESLRKELEKRKKISTNKVF